MTMEVDLRLGIVKLNWTAVDRSMVKGHTWANGGIYTAYCNCLIQRDGTIECGKYEPTPRISSFLGTLSRDLLKPSLWRYLIWKMKRLFHSSISMKVIY